MRDQKQTIELIDIHGPFAGQSRTYSISAGEAAVNNGFARLPDEDVVEDAEPSGDLPKDFPGCAELVAVGLGTYEEVPTVLADLTDLPGIGKVTAQKILEALGI